MELGITTFGDRFPDPRTGHLVSEQQRMQDLLEEIELADRDLDLERRLGCVGSPSRFF